MQSFAVDTERMVIHSFDVHPTIIDATYMEREGRENIKGFFTEMGVTWPDGSGINYIATMDSVTITNTLENIERFRDVLVWENLIPSMVEIQVDFVEFDLTDIDKLVREDKICRDSLQSLWEAGKGKLLSSGKAVSKSGHESTVKGVTEYVYPTEFEVTPKLALKGMDRNAPIATVEPQNFEMREVGNILQVVGEIMPRTNYIRLLLNPLHLCHPTWKNYSLLAEAKEKQTGQPPIEQPFFHVYTCG